MNKPVYKILNWIDKNKLNWQLLSSNKNAIELLKANQYNIYRSKLSKNPNAIELLKANQDKINLNRLSSNPNAIELYTNEN